MSIETEVIAARVDIISMAKIAYVYTKRSGRAPRKGELLRFAMDTLAEMFTGIGQVPEGVDEEKAKEFISLIFPEVRTSISRERRSITNEVSATLSRSSSSSVSIDDFFNEGRIVKAASGGRVLLGNEMIESESIYTTNSLDLEEEDRINAQILEREKRQEEERRAMIEAAKIRASNILENNNG